MKRKILWFSSVILATSTIGLWVMAQDGVRESQAAAVWQKIGNTEINITYSRPGVKGRKIWGDLVPWGEDPYPWRVGANENTTISFSTDVHVEGQTLPAGKYGLHMAPGRDQWTIIFSKVNDAWGSFSYKKANDALRVVVSPREASFVEWLRFDIDDLGESKATVSLRWEKVRVPFLIEAR